MFPALIVVVATGAAVLLFLRYRRIAESIEGCLRKQAFKRKGKVHPASLKAFPHLTFTHRGLDVLVSAYAEGSTVAYVSLPRYCDLIFEIRLRPSQTTLAKGMALTDVRTGHSKFDELFATQSTNAALVRKILDRRVRSALLRLAADKGVRVVLQNDSAKPVDASGDTEPRPRLGVHVPGVRSERSEYDRVIEVALMLSDRLLESVKATV